MVLLETLTFNRQLGVNVEALTPTANAEVL